MGGNVGTDTGTFASVMRRDSRRPEPHLIVSPFIAYGAPDAVFGWLQPALARGVSIEIRPRRRLSAEAVQELRIVLRTLRQAGCVTERADPPEFVMSRSTRLVRQLEFARVMALRGEPDAPGSRDVAGPSTLK